MNSVSKEKMKFDSMECVRESNLNFEKIGMEEI